MPRFTDHLELARICRVAAKESLEDYNFAVEKTRGWSIEDLAPPLLVSGDDLIGLGFSPGPRFKEILTRVEDEQLEGRLKTPQQALEFVKENYLR
jgi:poly(A) polymerase